jgi:glyoxylase-like metal-dependent hydrolase (beta-lactamase superfamily II)
MSSFCTKLPRETYKELDRIEFESDWFEVYRLPHDVTAIYEPHQWQEVISYLIEGKDQALLFDTGNGIGNIGAVVRELTSKPITVLNSHGHYDHVGGNYQFDRIIGMDTDFTRERQSGVAHESIAIEVSQEALCRELPTGVTQENHIGRPYQIERFIVDGHVIDLGDRQLEVLHIPGHTPDAIALIDRENRLMWTGDSFYAGPIWLFAPETNLNKYANSLDRLITEVPKVDALLPAHNTPWVSPDVLLRVRDGFDLMIKGKTELVDQGYGMIEHRIPGEAGFSFLMRDEALPYED